MFSGQSVTAWHTALTRTWVWTLVSSKASVQWCFLAKSMICLGVRITESAAVTGQPGIIPGFSSNQCQKAQSYLFLFLF